MQHYDPWFEQNMTQIQTHSCNNWHIKIMKLFCRKFIHECEKHFKFFVWWFPSWCNLTRQEFVVVENSKFDIFRGGRERCQQLSNTPSWSFVVVCATPNDPKQAQIEQTQESRSPACAGLRSSQFHLIWISCRHFSSVFVISALSNEFIFIFIRAFLYSLLPHGVWIGWFWIFYRHTRVVKWIKVSTSHPIDR